MAHMTFTYFSRALGMEVRLEAVLPELYRSQWQPRMPLVLLLHGMSDCESSYMRLSALERHAREHQVVIVTPATHMGSYTNQYAGSRYFDFVADELPEVCAAYLPVLTDREHLWAAGLSMGGYGALKLGFKYPERFSRIAAMSAGCDRAALLAPACADISTLEELYEKRDRLDARQFQGMMQFLATYGSRERFMKDETNNLFLLAEKAAQKDVLPAVCMWCGTEDMLAIEPNRRFHAHLKKLGIEHRYIEDHGVHDWLYWDSHLPAVLDWLDQK